MVESAGGGSQASLRGRPILGVRCEAHEIDIAVRPTRTPRFTAKKNDGTHRNARCISDGLPEHRMTTRLCSEEGAEAVADQPMVLIQPVNDSAPLPLGIHQTQLD
jgi:hypothetical protein